MHGGPDSSPQDAAYDRAVPPDYMAGAVGKMDRILGGMLPESVAGELRLVTTESPKNSHEAACSSELFALMASLSTQSLNQFALSLAGAEALTAEIASIYAGLREIVAPPPLPYESTRTRDGKSQMQEKARPTRLSVSEHYRPMAKKRKQYAQIAHRGT